MEKNIHEIGVFLDSNLNFKIRAFIWGLAKDLHVCQGIQEWTK